MEEGFNAISGIIFILVHTVNSQYLEPRHLKVWLVSKDTVGTQSFLLFTFQLHYLKLLISQS